MEFPLDEGWVECEATVPHTAGRSLGLVVLPNLLIEAVDPGSALGAAGVRAGMVLVGVDGTKVASDGHALDLVAASPGPTLKLSILLRKGDANAVAGAPTPRLPERQKIQRSPSPVGAAAVPRMFASMSQPVSTPNTEFGDNEVEDRVERILASTAARMNVEKQRNSFRPPSPRRNAPIEYEGSYEAGLVGRLPSPHLSPRNRQGVTPYAPPSPLATLHPFPRRDGMISAVDQPVWAGVEKPQSYRDRPTYDSGPLPRGNGNGNGGSWCCDNPMSIYCMNTGARHREGEWRRQ